MHIRRSQSVEKAWTPKVPRISECAPRSVRRVARQRGPRGLSEESIRRQKENRCLPVETNQRRLIIIREYKRKADARAGGSRANRWRSPTRPQPRRRPITRKDYAQGQGRADSASERTDARSLGPPRADIATKSRTPEIRIRRVSVCRRPARYSGLRLARAPALLVVLAAPPELASKNKVSLP